MTRTLTRFAMLGAAVVALDVAAIGAAVSAKETPEAQAVGKAARIAAQTFVRALDPRPCTPRPARLPGVEIGAPALAEARLDGACAGLGRLETARHAARAAHRDAMGRLDPARLARLRARLERLGADI